MYIFDRDGFLGHILIGSYLSYVFRIEQKFKQKNKYEYGFGSQLEPKTSKGMLNSKNKGHGKDGQNHDNQSKL